MGCWRSDLSLRYRFVKFFSEASLTCHPGTLPFAKLGDPLQVSSHRIRFDLPLDGFVSKGDCKRDLYEASSKHCASVWGAIFGAVERHSRSSSAEETSKQGGNSRDHAGKAQRARTCASDFEISISHQSHSQRQNARGATGDEDALRTTGATLTTFAMTTRHLTRYQEWSTGSEQLAQGRGDGTFQPLAG